MTYEQAVLADTPVAWWRMGDAPGSTVMLDSSGNSRHGIWVGSPTLGVPGLLTGDPTTAVEFDGVSPAYGRVTDASFMASLSLPEFSIEVWFETSVSGSRAITDKDENGDRAYQWQLNDGVLRFIPINGGVDIITGGSGLNNGVRHQGLVTYDATTVRLYVDGVQVASLVRGPIYGTDPFSIAGNFGGAGAPFSRFDGKIQDCSYYDYPLSAARVLVHYTEGVDPTPDDPPLDTPVPTVAATGTTATVSWAPIADATFYYMRIDGGTPFGPVTSSHEITGLSPATYYTIGVQARGGGSRADSEWGEIQFRTQDVSPPQVVGGGCKIGCPETTVFALNRCGTDSVCELSSNASNVEWARTMDDVSEASVTIDLSGEGLSEKPCCECIGGLRSWIHTIGIYRDGKLAWGPGPIVDILYKRDSTVFQVRDIAAWLDKRNIHNNYNFVNTPVLEVARILITDALGVDDPCDLVGSMIIIQPDGAPTVISQEYIAGTKMGEILRELARTVLDFTVVGVSIILAEALQFGPFGPLTDDDFLVDLEIQERGLEAATKWDVHGSGVTGVAGGVDPYYGLLEETAEEDNITSQAQVDAGAAGRLEASNPAPLYLNIPDGASLSPEAPICVDQLVPGAIVNVQVQKVCRPVNRQTRLTAVKTVVTAGEEKVGVTLSPVGINFDDASGTRPPGNP